MKKTKILKMRRKKTIPTMILRTGERRKRKKLLKRKLSKSKRLPRRP